MCRLFITAVVRKGVEVFVLLEIIFWTKGADEIFFIFLLSFMLLVIYIFPLFRIRFCFNAAFVLIIKHYTRQTLPTKIK